MMSAVLLGVIIFFRSINDKSVISQLFTIAGYTYGPLLGLYSFGLFTRNKVYDKWVPVIAVFSPAICYVVSSNSKEWLNSYEFGFELLILNGLLTFLGLLIISRVGPCSTILPRFITATRSAMWLTTLRSWEINR